MLTVFNIMGYSPQLFALIMSGKKISVYNQSFMLILKLQNK